MSDTKAYIRDCQSLVELNNALEYGADSMLKILESVNSYLVGVQDALKEPLAVIEENLHIAETELSEAERALSECEASQEWDEENETYYPSCGCEASRVSAARAVRDEVQEQYDRAHGIMDECCAEIAKYKSCGLVPGGERILLRLANDHTDKATSRMRDIIAAVEEYLQCDMSAGTIGSFSVHECDVTMPVSDNPLTPEQKKARFTDAVQRVIDRQQEENGGVVDANRVMVCPKCGRPLVACICSNTREREYTRDDSSYIFDKSFSR